MHIHMYVQYSLPVCVHLWLYMCGCVPALAVTLCPSFSPHNMQLQRPPRSGGAVNLGYDISQVTGAESQSQLDGVIEEYVPKVRPKLSLYMVNMVRFCLMPIGG